ncbi:hypothetical protein BDY24DRAFT_374531 [Mrakia frigida]|uniref:uncharacterized protein n=1 Tax=Mrakia frigida TaxID=29902 RepID=UPI003FCBFDAA
MAVPPFTLASAHSKVQAAAKAWNSQLPSKIALAYTPDSVWRNRDQFVRGRDEIFSFLEKKWEKEKNYTLRKELFAFNDNKIAVQFW